MTKVKIKTTDEQFYEAHNLLDKVRKNTKDVSVPKEILINLLQDHEAMQEAINKDVTIIRYKGEN